MDITTTELPEGSANKPPIIENKPLRMLQLLLDGWRVEIDTGHTLTGNEGIIGYVFTRQIGDSPTEEVLLPCEWTINDFIKFAENYDNDKLWLALANQALTKYNQR